MNIYEITLNALYALEEEIDNQNAGFKKYARKILLYHQNELESLLFKVINESIPMSDFNNFLNFELTKVKEKLLSMNSDEPDKIDKGITAIKSELNHAVKLAMLVKKKPEKTRLNNQRFAL